MKRQRCTGEFDCTCPLHQLDHRVFVLRANEAHNRVRRLLGWPELTNGQTR